MNNFLLFDAKIIIICSDFRQLLTVLSREIRSNSVGLSINFFLILYHHDS